MAVPDIGSGGTLIAVLSQTTSILRATCDQMFLDALVSLKTMFKVKWVINWCFQDYKISRVLQSITEYNRVLQSIAEYYRVLQSITEYCRVLQSITEYCRELQSITEYYRV